MKMTHVLLALLMAPAAAQTQTNDAAQAVWRCGPDGSSYSATKCPQGRAVATNAARPTADVQAALAAAKREASLAEKLRQERLQAEARAMGNGSGNLSAVRPVPVKPAATAAAQNKPKKPATPKKTQRHAAKVGTSTTAAQVSRRKKD